MLSSCGEFGVCLLHLCIKNNGRTYINVEVFCCKVESMIKAFDVNRLASLVTFIDRCHAISIDGNIFQLPSAVVIGILVPDVFP